MLSTKLKEAAGNSADATLYVDDVFSTWLYTGNGSTQTITNGIDLAGKGGMTWIKSRSAATDHKLTDTVRGATKALISNTTGAETTDTTGLTAFSSTGFSLGANSVYNTNATTYASWTFRKAARFFDVVTYTGDGTDGRNIAHSLGVTPACIIVKRTDSTSNWSVYHQGNINGSGSGQNTYSLNTTGAANNLFTVDRTNSTNFNVSDAGAGTDSCNVNGGTYVAYLFASNAGGFGITGTDNVISCGSFTGPSTTLNVIIGFEIQYLLIKRTDAAGDDWYIQDIMRGMPLSGTGSLLSANTADAQLGLSAPIIYPNATGFTVVNGSGVTASGGTYIYMAIRRPNKPPTTGTQVYNAIAYTGAGTNPITINNIGFIPDLVSNFSISVAGQGAIWLDRLRGGSVNLEPRSTGTENSQTAVTATFDKMTTLTLSGGDANASGTVFINHFFKRATGFFDEVCYTGTGSATTQAHNLTVVPELMIVKVRSAVNDWWVYVSSVGNTKYSVLNSTAVPVTSSTAWNNTTPTASVFSIGTATNVNASAQTFVAYLFATLAGISKVGSYTGNGTGQAIACGFGSGGARFVLIKRTDSTGDWYTFDSARGLTSGSSPYLLLNSTAAEVTGNNGVYASSGGFTLGATAITTTNIASATYIFLAVA
jgi:hypothetical protein